MVLAFPKHLMLPSPQLSKAGKYCNPSAERAKDRLLLKCAQISLLSSSSNAQGSDCHWMLVPSTGQIKKWRGCWDPGMVYSHRIALLRLTDYLPFRKGSIQKALSLIHHLPLLHARSFWFVGYAGFVQAHLILSRKTANAPRPHWPFKLVFRGAQSTACFISLLLWCRPSIRSGSSSIELTAGKDLLCKGRLQRAADEAPVW